MIIKITISLALVVFLATVHAEQRFQSHDAIYAAVRSAIEKKINHSIEYEINVIALDSQLQLPECAMPLEAYVKADIVKAGRTTVGVRCNTQNKWTIFSSAVVKFFAAVMVLTEPVQRGEIIAGQMLVSEKRDVSTLREDYFTQAEQVENKQAARALAAGTILSLRNLSEPKLVKKGDKVVISTTQTAFSITMSGLAMMDGRKGQLIKVKNLSSGRIINATVIEPGLVSVK